MEKAYSWLANPIIWPWANFISFVLFKKNKPGSIYHTCALFDSLISGFGWLINFILLTQKFLVWKPSQWQLAGQQSREEWITHIKSRETSSSLAQLYVCLFCYFCFYFLTSLAKSNGGYFFSVSKVRNTFIIFYNVTKQKQRLSISFQREAHTIYIKNNQTVCFYRLSPPKWCQKMLKKRGGGGAYAMSFYINIYHVIYFDSVFLHCLSFFLS